jgi:hypothetical protein
MKRGEALVGVEISLSMSEHIRIEIGIKDT